jgi:hypothetical protein
MIAQTPVYSIHSGFKRHFTPAGALALVEKSFSLGTRIALPNCIRITARKDTSNKFSPLHVGLKFCKAIVAV